ncbi:hypothetical protein XELAEV_18016592mg [Xenopus laevis]|uniref:Solute carrier organic anion transporter family member n=1 Tax=Xenopus laevis TaxID=8355 RepID=A0A974HS23_XENLA|nr:hypothetical protein XELAEV_18016592mg [Xenopus laevis]
MDPTKEQRRLCCPSGQEKSPPRGSGLVGKGCFKGLEIFLAALCFVYFAKALAGSYLKSTITQIERRFDIPSSLVGVIDGSFEIGNLLVILLVSYFGARLHRPKIIGTGCLIMAAGTFLIAMPHFFMGRYSYERPLVHSANSSINVSPCAQDSRDPKFIPSENPHRNLGTGCEKDLGNSMWVYILLGNLLRGVGEAPIQPLGISYIDDYTSEDNTAFYIGCVQTSAVIGPIFGFLLGSLCAKLFVDIGSVNLDSVTITPADAHWVGAWWLGYLIAGGISILATIPFWFLPKEQPRAEMHKNSGTSSEQSRFILEEQNEANTEQDQVHLLNMVKDFLPSVKDLLGNPVYFLYLCGSVFQYNSLIGMVTYKPKYIEQQYGQTSSKTNFLIGLINIPAVALGIFSGGVIMKRFRINILGAAKLLLGPSLLGYLMLFSLFAMGCKNSSMAGLTVSYQGSAQISNQENGVSECNVGCRCPLSHWDPVCGENGLTYYSACFAGCSVSSATGKRAVTGIPAPMYLGALIDTVCLKWSSKNCSGRGACRFYNMDAFRYIYLGMTLALGTVFIFMTAAVVLMVQKRFHPTENKAADGRCTGSALPQNGNLVSNLNLLQTTYWAHKETRL